MNGCTGNLLRVDLTKGTHAIETIDPSMAESFLGGRGLATKIYANEVPPDVDPLSPENKLIFASGPLVGTGAIGGAFCCIVSKSPTTGILNCGRTRGHFGAEMKYAGFDAIILEGKSDFPVYLITIDDRIAIRPAMQLWGRTNSMTDEMIKAELDDRWVARETYTASIGPAGENLSNLSVVVTEGTTQTLGGAGLAAVMGSKNLKAIAVKGRHSVMVADGNRLMQVVTTLINRLNSSPFTAESMPTWGTAFLLRLCSQRGILPINNFGHVAVKELSVTAMETLSRMAAFQRKGCFACPIGCLKRPAISDGPKSAIIPGFEAMSALGINCGISDLDSIRELYHFCSDMGMGSIALGGTLAAAMDLEEKGRVSTEEMGVDLRFGMPDEALKMTELAAKNKGFGKILSKGAKELARYFEEPMVFNGVKGLPMPAIDPRGIQEMGLHFATSNFGSHYFCGYTLLDEVLNLQEGIDPLEVTGKAGMVKNFQDIGAAIDSLGICLFLMMGLQPKNLIPMINAVMGTQMNIDDLQKAGERIWNLERASNIKMGLTGEDDTLPHRFLEEPMEEGPAKGQVCRLSEMLPEYYSLRGWDEKGVPLGETLQILGLE